MNNSDPMFIRVTPDAVTAYLFELERQANALDSNLALARAAHAEALSGYHRMVALNAPQEILQERAAAMIQLEEDMMRVEQNVERVKARIHAMHPLSENRRQPA